MHDILRKYIDGVTSSVISDEEFVYIEQAFDIKKIKRKQFLLHEGSVCRWMSDRGSFMNQTPSRYNIEAVEDSALLVTTLDKINLLKEQSLTFLKMAHIIDQNHAIASQKRVEAGMRYSAEEKYRYLMQAHPEFFNRFPQGMLASYLGLTPETMSRVRKQILFPDK